MDPDLLRVADALRRVINQIVVIDAPAEALAAVADAIDAASALLTPHTLVIPSRRRDPSAPLDPHRFFPFSPVIGHYNPLAAPIEVHIDDDRRVRGTVRFGAAYEGPPGFVHGGMIAAAFDELLGVANIANETPGMTGTLTIRYLKPTPLHADLGVEGWTDRVEGRKVFTVGRITHHGEVTAEAEGIFIQLRPERALEVFGDDDRGF